VSRGRENPAVASSFPFDPLLKVAVMGMVVAGTIELVGFLEHHGLSVSFGM
jgi:hypothetical protein